MSTPPPGPVANRTAPSELWVALGHVPEGVRSKRGRKRALRSTDAALEAEDPGGELRSGDEDEGSGSELQDDQYDDEEDGGDYDAEQYFDDGGDDGGDDDGGQGADYYD